MNLFFTDPYTKQERVLELMSQPYGGWQDNLFVDAVDKETKELGTYLFEQVKVKIPLRDFLNIKKHISKIKAILRS